MRAPMGLSLATFCAFAEPFTADYETEADAYFSVEQPRQYQSGGRCKGLLARPKQNFFTLLYLKIYPTFDVLGATFSLPPSEACEHTRRLAKTVERCLRTLGVLPGRAIDWLAQMQAVFADVPVLLLAATERLYRRAHAAVDRPADYSGKKGPPIKTRSSPTPPGTFTT